jgi:hypothetical protein
MVRKLARASLLVLFCALIAAPASAQIVQAMHIGGGAFFPRGDNGRVSGDVLVEDLNSLTFHIGDFTSGQLFGEWLFQFGNHIELGAGVGYYHDSTPSYYTDYEDQRDGSNIEQELSLRIVPISGFVRFLPFGRPSTVQPYFGVGLSALNYRYVESGEFIDFTDNTIFPHQYVATGTAIGPLVLAGIRVPIKGDIWAFTTEWRYQAGSGKTGGIPAGFLNDKIDLGGNHWNFGFLMRF